MCNGHIRDHRGSILSLAKYDERLFSLWIGWDSESDVVPGQFVTIRFPDRMDPLLGRPLAIAESEPGRIRLLFRVVGRLTAELSSLPDGTALSVRGPIGRGFPMESGRKRILVAGTTGFAAILASYRKTTPELVGDVILGVPDGSWETFAKAMRDEIPALRIFSQDGSFGETGTALDGLPLVLPDDTDIWVSMEHRMACGMGGCLGCSISTRDGMKRVCVDGPVFRAEEVEWNESRSEA